MARWPVRRLAGDDRDGLGLQPDAVLSQIARTLRSTATSMLGSYTTGFAPFVAHRDPYFPVSPQIISCVGP
jgi:hypothetical protein